METFMRGLTPPSLKLKAHQLQIENPATTWQNLPDQFSNKDNSYSMSSEFTGTSSYSIDKKLEDQEIRQELKELGSLLKDQKINATYNNNNQTENSSFKQKSN